MFKGFSLIEMIIAIGLFAILVVGGAGIINLNNNSARIAFEYDQAYAYLYEGIETVRLIRGNDWSNLQNGTYGLLENSGSYEFIESPDTWLKYTREIEILDAYRDINGNISTSNSGVLDQNIKQIRIRVSWDYSSTKSKTIEQTFFLTNWSLPITVI